MTNKQKIINICLWIVLVFLGIFIDRCFKNIPFFELDKKINILSAASLIVTVILTFLVPFFINKLIENQKWTKVFIIDELKELITAISKVKSVISSSHDLGSFVPGDRDKILYAFHETELKVNSIEQQIKASLNGHKQNIIEDIKNGYFEYKDYVTGGELMTSSFVQVDDKFYKENNTEYSKIETIIKTSIQKIFKL